MKNNDSYEQSLNKFIMRACEVNSDIGNDTIDKYLRLNNSEMCAKIVTEIMMSSKSCLSERIQKVHKFIEENMRNDAPPALEPFLEKICQLYFSIEKKNESEEIKLQISQENILQLINNPKKSEVYAKYMCKILSLKTPFIVEGINSD